MMCAWNSEKCGSETPEIDDLVDDEVTVTSPAVYSNTPDAGDGPQDDLLNSHPPPLPLPAELDSPFNLLAIHL